MTTFLRMAELYVPQLTLKRKSADNLVNFYKTHFKHATWSRRCRRRQEETVNLTGQLPALIFSNKSASEQLLCIGFIEKWLDMILKSNSYQIGCSTSHLKEK